MVSSVELGQEEDWVTADDQTGGEQNRGRETNAVGKQL